MLFVRLLILTALAWFAIRLSHASGVATHELLRVSLQGALLLGLWLGVAALAWAVLRPGFAAWIGDGGTGGKLIVLAAWVPGGLLVYAGGFLLASEAGQPLWNGAFGALYWISSLAMVIGCLDALRVSMGNPRLWLVLASVISALLAAAAGGHIWNRRTFPHGSRSRSLYTTGQFDSNLARFVPHHYELYIPRPGWKSPNGLDRIGSLGFRGQEVIVPKPQGTYRIVALGGSTTYDTAVDDWRDAYPAQLESVLRSEYGYENVEVVNAGVGGHNSWEMLVELEFRVLDLQPDLVIACEVLNDVHSRMVPPDRYRGDNSGRRRPWDGDAVAASARSLRVPSVLWRLLAVRFGWFGTRSGLNLESVASWPCTGQMGADVRCLGLTPEEVLHRNPPKYFERNFRNIIAVCKTNGVEVMLLTWAHKKDALGYTRSSTFQSAYAEHNEILRRLARESGTYFSDLESGVPADDRYWAQDGRHMSAEGNHLRAGLIAASLDEAGAIPRIFWPMLVSGESR